MYPLLCAPQRDVPGLTRVAIPTLVSAGVLAITIGVNGGSASPDLPNNKAFVWRDESSGAQAIMIQHPGELHSSTP